MKAKLLLEISYLFEKEYEPEEDSEVLSLSLVVGDKVKYDLYNTEYLNDEDIDDYFTKLEEIVNQIILIKNSIPGIQLVIDESICEFIDDKELEIKNHLQQLIVEI